MKNFLREILFINIIYRLLPNAVNLMFISLENILFVLICESFFMESVEIINGFYDFVKSDDVLDYC